MRPSIINARRVTRTLVVLFPLLAGFFGTGLLLAQNNVSGAAAASVTADGAEEPITLEQAIQIALEKNPLRKVALADQKAATAGVKQAQSLLLPHIEFSESATRGNDPVYVFGTKLRQQRFTVADFALNQLNTPTPISNFSSRFAGEWNLFDSFGSWKNVSRTRFMQQASAAQLERTDQELVFRAVEAYYGVLLRGEAARGRAAIDRSSAVRARTSEGPIRFRAGRGIGFLECAGERGVATARV